MKTGISFAGNLIVDRIRKIDRLPGKRLPKGFIGGTVGAGDAFCTGVLLAALRGCDIGEALRCGNASAVASLRADTPNDSMIPIEDALTLCDALASV